METFPPKIFFDDEDEEVLKLQFIELCAKHKNNFSAFEVAKYIFRDLRDPGMRSLQAADYWSKDLAVQEAIRQRVLLGSDAPILNQSDIERRLLEIADSITTCAKDKIDALKTIAQINGMITKPIDIKSNGKSVGGLPIFNIMPYPDEDVATDD